MSFLPRGRSYPSIVVPTGCSSRFPCPEGALIRGHWRGGRARPARTGLRWSPGPMNSFFTPSEPRFPQLSSSAVISLCRPLIRTLCWTQPLSGLRLLDAPMDCSLPGSSILGILQARILEWVAMPSSRGSPQPRAQTQVSHTAGRCFMSEPPGKDADDGIWDPPR